MLNDILIRKGNFNDVSSIHHIEKTVFNEEAWSLNMVEDELSTSNYRKTWVACVKNFLCAYYMLRSYENDYHLINIAVVPFYQRLGLGEKLIKHMLGRIPVGSSIFLEVKKGNFSAISLYRKMGFKDIYIRNNYYKDGKSALIMNLNF